MRDGITVICFGHNEGKRADAFFKSVSMFDEVIFGDRGCEDNTCEIASKYENVTIYKMNYTARPEKEPDIVTNDIKSMIEMASNKWILRLGFADIVHPRLYGQLIGLLNKNNFTYTEVWVPWVEYLFGVEDEDIPNCHYLRPVLSNKEYIKYSGVTHRESTVTKKKVYKMKKNKRVAIHHMTYIDLRYSFMEQHIRYCKQEVTTYYSLKESPKREILKDAFLRWCSDVSVIKRAIHNKKEKEIIMHGISISVYRTWEYSATLYLLQWAVDKPKFLDRIFKIIYDGIEKNPKTKKVQPKKMIKLCIEVFKNGTCNFFDDISAIIAIGIIVNSMLYMAIWDSRREKSAEEIYNSLKMQILSDEQ